MEEVESITVCPTCNKIDCLKHKTLEIVPTDLMHILKWKITNSTNKE